MHIDATYMNRWLGGKYEITELSPKTMHDVRVLIEHYRNIVVPEKKVAVEFPTSDTKVTPHASIECSKVVIPFYLLENGKIDQTIGAMIHELNHIKYSPSERYIQALAFKFLKEITKKISYEGVSLSSRIFSDSSVTKEAVIGDGPVSNTAQFVRDMVSDLLFFMNAVEDVRIDGLAPPNLRKYVDKMDADSADKLRNLFDSGALDDKNLLSLGFLLIGHYKDFFFSPTVDKRFYSRQGIIDANPTDLTIALFEEFSPEIAAHILENYVDRFSSPSPSDSLEEGEIDVDGYFASKVGDGSSQNVEEQFIQAHSQNVREQADETVRKELDQEMSALHKAFQELEDVVKELKEDSIPLSKVDRSDNPCMAVDSVQKYKQEVEDKKTASVLSPSLLSQVNSFKNIQVHTTQEIFSDKAVTFDIVIFDTL